MAWAPLPPAPFDTWPVQVFDPAFGFCWYARPATFVSCSVIERGTRHAVEIVQSHIDHVLRLREGEVRAAGGLFILHDWRATRGYDADARTAYLTRTRARPKDYLRHSITCVPSTPLFRMAVETGNLVSSMISGAKVELAKDPTWALQRFAVEKPAIGSRFPR